MRSVRGIVCKGFWIFYGVIHSPKAIKTALGIQPFKKAMRSPFPRRHRRSLQ